MDVNAKRMHKFEYTRLISTRALQISENAPVYVSKVDSTHSSDIAENEFNEGKIPLKVIKR